MMRQLSAGSLHRLETLRCHNWLVKNDFPAHRHRTRDYRFFVSIDNRRATVTKFQEMPEISENTKKAIAEILKFSTLSPMQRKVLPAVLNTMKQPSTLKQLSPAVPPDLLIQSQAGTGKTLAYLILVIESLLRNSSKGIGALIIAPTRELAMQIAREAQLLLTFHSLEILTLVGGSKKKLDVMNLKWKRPHIIVCTAGRLLYHLQETYLFKILFEQLDILVLDEADRLLELGHRLALNTILSYLPSHRQTLLCSASLTDQLKDLVRFACKGDYLFLDCIEAQSPVSSTLDQMAITHPSEKTLTVLMNILTREMRNNSDSYKIIVFFPSSRMTAFSSSFFRQQFRIGVYELHRRRDYTTRSSISQRFSRDTRGILFTSDISSRGMDYPDVTLVIQVGAPVTFSQYMHRVGRTARIGKPGKSIIMLNEKEQTLLSAQEYKELAIETIEDSSLFENDERVNRALQGWLSNAQLQFSASMAYSSLLYYYRNQQVKLHLTMDEVVKLCSSIMASCGMTYTPSISKQLAVALQLENHPEISVGFESSD